jgi:type IV secretion system protein VirB10
MAFDDDTEDQDQTDFLPDEDVIPPYTNPGTPAAENPFEDQESGSFFRGEDEEDSNEDSNTVSEIEVEAPPSRPELSGELEPDEPRVSPDMNTIQDEQSIVEPYQEKTSANSAMGISEPRKLNRQLILYIIAGVFCLFIVFSTFVLPAFRKQKARDSANKPRVVQNAPADYSSLVSRPPKTTVHEEPAEEEIPDPLTYYYEQKKEEPPQNPSTPVSGGRGYERPDTRNDRLQAKSISGIKGITPSQKNYLTPDQGVPVSVDGQGAPVRGPSAMTVASNPYAQFGMPPKDEYMQNLLASYGQGANTYAQQNDQGGKMNFYNQNRDNAGTGQWLAPNTVWQGTIFEAILTSSINTDLPGEATAWVTKNVYASQDGKYLLIPQNSRLFGSYNSSISYSQSRVQVGWHTLIRPDGYMINLGNMQATDPQGATGLKGFINDHPFQYLKALALLTAFNIVNNEFTATMADTQNQYVQNIMANSQEMANLLGSKLIDRALDVQPTITIKSGTKINVVVNTTLTLPPLPLYEVTRPYHKGE